MVSWYELEKRHTAWLAPSRCSCALNSIHHHMGQLHLLDGWRESGRSILDREDSMSKGTKMVNSGRGGIVVKTLNSKHSIGVERPDLEFSGGSG